MPNWASIAKGRNTGVLMPKGSHFGVDQNKDILIPKCRYFFVKMQLF
jgi:hypothetical protein